MLLSIRAVELATRGVCEDVDFSRDVRRGHEEVMLYLKMGEDLEKVDNKRVRRTKTRHPTQSTRIVGGENVYVSRSGG